MSQEHQRHHRRKRVARIYLCGIFLLIIAGHALLLRFAFSDSNPFPTLKGVLFGSILASTLLVGGIWRRRAWTRYVLMVLLGLMVGVMGMVLLIIGARPDLATGNTYLLLCGGTGLFVVAEGWLIFSKRLLYLVTSAGGA